MKYIDAQSAERREKVKYCLSIRQPQHILAQADEIKLPYKDIDILKDYINKFPKATFIVELDSSTDWSLLDYYIELSKGRIIAALNDLNCRSLCIEHLLPFYWTHPIYTYHEAKALVDAGACYLNISAPLTHDLPNISKYDTPLRMAPDIAFGPLLPHTSGIAGQYVRPEDVSLYENYISTFEFVERDLLKQRTLFKIYSKREWPGNLALLVKNLNEVVDNRGFPVDFAARRIGCRQVCQMPGPHCNYCYSTLRFINTASRLASSTAQEDADILALPGVE